MSLYYCRTGDGGHNRTWFGCPKCGEWEVATDAQIKGVVALVCPVCEWHEFHDLEFEGEELTVTQMAAMWADKDRLPEEMQ